MGVEVYNYEKGHVFLRSSVKTLFLHYVNAYYLRGIGLSRNNI